MAECFTDPGTVTIAVPCESVEIEGGATELESSFAFSVQLNQIDTNFYTEIAIELSTVLNSVLFSWSAPELKFH